MPSQRRGPRPVPSSTSTGVKKIPARNVSVVRPARTWQQITRHMPPNPTDDQVLALGRAFQAGLSRKRAAEYAGVSDQQVLFWFENQPNLEQQLLTIRAQASYERIQIAEAKAREEDSRSMIHFIKLVDPDFGDRLTVDHNVSVDPDHGKLVVEFRKDWPSA